ncbi:MAG: 3-oxoadipate enol-lactonase [Rhodospirillaceae bacterium]|nr:3-oxoadipate enol-lactonase [Rhodospirillaceae bacterium]|tara:strand:+ start:926 stop:1714 length:789 start_codon:yes stop_codon:yes gene_type:complete
MDVTVNGARIHYTLDGPESAPVVTMSNSLAANLSMWAPQLPALADDYRVLRYDTRGHGSSEPVPGPYSLEMLAEDVVALWDTLGIERAHFVGLSLGGMIGQVLGRTAGDRLVSLVLCDTMGAMPPAMKSVWADRIATAEKDGMGALVDSTIQRWFTPRCIAERPDLVDPVRQMIRGTSVQGYTGCCAAISQLDELDKVSAIRTPTLIVCGEDDPATPVAASEALQEKIGGAELTVIKSAAHFANWEQPEAFNDALIGFLQRF